MYLHVPNSQDQLSGSKARSDRSGCSGKENSRVCWTGWWVGWNGTCPQHLLASAWAAYLMQKQNTSVHHAHLTDVHASLDKDPAWRSRGRLGVHLWQPSGGSVAALSAGPPATPRRQAQRFRSPLTLRRLPQRRWLCGRAREARSLLPPWQSQGSLGTWGHRSQ